MNVLTLYHNLHNSIFIVSQNNFTLYTFTLNNMNAVINIKMLICFSYRLLFVISYCCRNTPTLLIICNVIITYLIVHMCTCACVAKASHTMLCFSKPTVTPKHEFPLIYLVRMLIYNNINDNNTK